MQPKKFLIPTLLMTLWILVGCTSSSTIPQPNNISVDGQPELYIWPNSNSHSNNEVALSLLVEAGSLQERDSELGYAHFVEHMAFNGTQAFPGDAIREQLEYLGMTLGDHVNAYTTYDHTRYDIYLNTRDPERLEAAIQLLSEWAYRIEFSEQEVRKEKPVIVEEWRQSEVESGRVQARIQENYYSGTRHAERKPIGTRQSIESASAAELRDFYDRWYRADNMAVIVAGDVDSTRVAELVSQYFPKDTRPVVEPETYVLNPDATEQRLILTDPFIANGFVSMDHYVERPPVQTVDDLMARYHWIAALDIWHNRVQARLQNTEGAVVDADYSWNYISPDTLNISLSAYLTNSDFESALNIIEGERQRLVSGGITAAELDDWRTGLLTHERSQQDSAGHLADLISDHINADWPMLGQPERIRLLETQLDELTPESVQAAFTALFVPDPNVTVVHPNRSPAPTSEDIDSWMANVTLPPSSATAAGQTDPDWPIDPATAGTIVKEETLAQDVTRWTLSNGMTVFYRYSKQTPDKVYYELSGVHGLNALSTSETFAARLALPTLGTSGLRAMNGSQLSEWLNANGLVQIPTFSFFQRGMYGSGPSDKFPVMMRLLHVALTEARVDAAAWRHIRNQNREQLSQIDGHPHQPWFEAVEQTLFRNDDALKTLTMEELNQVDPGAMQAVYDSYFSGTQNYQLAVVGDADKKAVRESIIEAMATLPERSADWSTPRAYPEPEMSVSKTITGSGEQAASVTLRYSVPKSVFPEQGLIAFRLLESWIDQALFQEIRENRGYVYSINSSLDGASIAQTDMTLIIQLATDPDNVETVVDTIHSELAMLPDQPASQRQINQWHQTLQQDFQQTINGAEQQAEALAYAPMYGKDPVNALVFDSEGPATPQQLSELAVLFTGPESKSVELIWMP